MSTVGKHMKMCITCTYFNGDRTPRMGGFVEFDSSQKGKCYQLFPEGVTKKPMWCCSAWELWAPLKK